MLGKELGDRVPGGDHAERAVVLGVPRLRDGRARPGPSRHALAYRAAHHLNLAHGRAVTALRGVLPADRRSLGHPQPPPGAAGRPTREEDLAAAEHVDLIANRIFLDPMFGGGYSEDLLATTAHLTDWAFVQPGDEAEIGAALDSVGVNYYNPARVAAQDGTGKSLPRHATGRASSTSPARGP